MVVLVGLLEVVVVVLVVVWAGLVRMVGGLTVVDAMVGFLILGFAAGGFEILPGREWLVVLSKIESPAWNEMYFVWVYRRCQAQSSLQKTFAGLALFCFEQAFKKSSMERGPKISAILHL